MLNNLSYYLSNDRKIVKSFAEHNKLSIEYLIIDGLILALFCYIGIVANLTPDNFVENGFPLLAVIYLGWLVSAAITHKFIPVVIPTKRLKSFEFKVKFYLWFIALIVLSMVFVHIGFNSLVGFIKTLIGYSLLSSLVSVFLFAAKKENKTDDPTIKFLKAYEIKDRVLLSIVKKRDLKYSFNSTEVNESVVKERMHFEYLKEYEDVFLLLDNILDFKSFDTRKTVIIKSNDPNDISLTQPELYQLFVNLHILNEQNQLNNYLLDVRKTLVQGGVFVGALHPNHYRYHRFLKKYSFGIGKTLYFFDFIWNRIFPKLPITRGIYFTFSKGKDRDISLAEGLGRLVYSGFRVLDLAVVDEVVYFAAVKDKGSTPEKKLFYSLIFKMQRIGQDGKMIYVYKIRTMHPYSEYIQDFIHNLNGQGKGVKIKDDFRVASWGQFLRKYWLDELPMLINLLKGDIKLVGVRPLSHSMFNLYPLDLQKLRTSTKPGLIPPFYSDVPETFDEVLDSERKYLLAYKRNPIKTDIKYFFKCWYNIIIKHARSL
jgi:lipopolysaccharide/colanic/teichoic acid biosynthesis glycosyltransferase